jgi:hypothetical protein
VLPLLSTYSVTVCVELIAVATPSPVARVCNSVWAAAGIAANWTVVELGRLVSVPAEFTVTVVLAPLAV